MDTMYGRGGVPMKLQAVTLLATGALVVASTAQAQSDTTSRPRSTRGIPISKEAPATPAPMSRTDTVTLYRTDTVATYVHDTVTVYRTDTVQTSAGTVAMPMMLRQI